MKFKPDENFGIWMAQIFRDAGHDVQTVRNEGLQEASDQSLYEVCCAEQYCLVTLDMDFSEVIRFPPNKTGGIVIIRFPNHPTPDILEELIRQFLKTITQILVEKQLWIVETGRIRVHQQE